MFVYRLEELDGVPVVLTEPRMQANNNKSDQETSPALENRAEDVWAASPISQQIGVYPLLRFIRRLPANFCREFPPMIQLLLQKKLRNLQQNEILQVSNVRSSNFYLTDPLVFCIVGAVAC